MEILKYIAKLESIKKDNKEFCLEMLLILVSLPAVYFIAFVLAPVFLTK